MPLTDYQILGPADLTREQFRAILRDGQSPALGESDSMYLALTNVDVRPAPFLAFFRVESRLGTVGIAKEYDTKNPGNVRSPERATLARKIVQTPRGPFAKYPTWTDGTIDWAARLRGPKYAGAGLTTVRTVLPKYAPSGDQDNNPVAYIKAVLDSIEEWTRQSGTGGATVALQKPPVDTSHPSPNRGYATGVHRVDAVIWHITQGSNSLGWLTNPASGASSNYLIARTGKTYELVPPTESAWANGRVCNPDADHNQPLVTKWIAEGVNFNRRTVSIECEGMSSLGHGGSLTASQITSLVKITAWLCQTFNLTPDKHHVFGHFEVDSCDRPNCPGYSTAEWIEWVRQVAALLGGTPTPPMLSPVVTERRDWGEGSKGRIIAQTVTVANDDTGAYYEGKTEYRAEGPVQLPWKEV